MFRSDSVLQDRKKEGKAQIALEFMIVYSFVLVIFMILFVLIVNQRSLTLNQQEYSSLQLVTQNIVNYINQALSSGNGYNATVLIPGEIGTAPYTIEISSSGVVIANLTTGKRTTLAYAFSRARSLQINGVQKLSANGVTLYQINNIGQVSIANSKGTIYIDKIPVSTLPLTNLFVTAQTSSAKMAEFKNNIATSAYSSNTYVKAYAPSIAGSNVPFTVAMWIYVPSNSQSNMPFFGMNNYQALEFFRGGLGSTTDQVFLHRCSSADTGESTIPVMTYNTWHFVAVSVSAPNYYFQLDGSNSVVTNAYAYSDNGYITIGTQAAQCDGNVFVGDIADMQLYNTSLSATQLQQLYAEGMGAPPVQSANVVGWWPLDGNTNDYSGNGYVGTPSNITYGTLAQLVSRSVLGNGGTSIDSLIGMIADNGTFNQSGEGDVALLSNSTGYAKTFLTGGNVSNIAVDSYAFNGNQSTVGNLIGWWPLVVSAPDAGNTVYDLSEHYNNGAVSNAQWANYSQTTTNLLAAQFGGAGETPITAKLPVVSNTVFSLSLWFYPTSSSDYGGLAYFGTTLGTGWGPVASTSAGAGGCSAGPANSVYVLQSGIGWDCVSSTYKPNQWNYFALTGAPSGSNVNYTFYLNGNTINDVVGTPIPPQGNFIIGSTAESDNFVGSISNVQLYSDTLSAAQLAQIYNEGVSGTPLGSNTLLEDWWPLAGNANDYTSSPDNGTVSGVTFNSIDYTGMSSSNMKVLDFGGNGYAETGIAGLPTGSSARTMVAWVNIPSYSNGGCGQEMAMGYGPSGGQAEFAGLGMEINGDVSFASNGNDYGAPMVVPLGKWTFIAVTYASGSTQVTLYMNSQSSTGTLSSGLPLNTPTSGITSYIGAWGGGGCRFTGKIAEAQIYNTNLTATQISQLYQEGLPQMVYKNLTFG